MAEPTPRAIDVEDLEAEVRRKLEEVAVAFGKHADDLVEAWENLRVALDAEVEAGSPLGLELARNGWKLADEGPLERKARKAREREEGLERVRPRRAPRELGRRARGRGGRR